MINIADKINKNIYQRNGGGAYACNSVWASEAGHDCERYLVYHQLNWTDMPDVDERLAMIFNEGNWHEKQVLRELQELDLTIKQLQQAFTIKSAGISGKIDCIVEIDCITAPVEIKSMSDRVYNSINTVDDLKKYPWTKKYYAQLLLQMKNDMMNFDTAYFLCKNKQTGEHKHIYDTDGSPLIKFNQEEYDKIIEKAKHITAYVSWNKDIDKEIEQCEDEAEKEVLQSKKYMPDRIKYDIKVCRGCAFEAVCCGNLIDSSIENITDEGVKDLVVDYLIKKDAKNSVKRVVKDYDEIKEALKSLFPVENKTYIFNDWMIETKTRKNSKGGEYLTFDVKNINEIGAEKNG